MSPKRILFVEVSGRAGGSNVSLRALLAGLDRKRYSPVVVLGDRGNRVQWDEEVYEMNLAGLDNFDFFPASWTIRWTHQFVRFILHFPVDLFLAARILGRLKPSIVHVNVGQAVTFGIAARLMGLPVVWHVRELVVQNALGRLQDNLYAWCSRRVIATSHAVASRLKACAPKIVVIPNSVLPPSVEQGDLDRFRSRHALHDEDFVLLLLANSLLVSKGFLFLAEVADRLTACTRIRFLLAGHNVDAAAPAMHRIFRKAYRRAHGGKGEKERIMERWKGHVAAGRAAFTGYVDPALAIASCSVVVCPNLIAEPFGRSVIEANVQSKPVIASNIPAFDEVISDGESGWLVPPLVESWVSIISALQANAALVRRAGREANLRSAQFTAEHHSRVLMELYDDVTGCA